MIISEELVNHSIFLIDPKREIEAILFDMDGVLADSIPLHIQAWNVVFEEYNLSMFDRSDYLFTLGRTNIDMLTRILSVQNRPLPLSMKKNIIESKERCFRKLIKEQISPIPGVIDWLNYFKQKQIRCSLASSGEMANIISVLEALQVSDYFSSIISGAHLPASKPNPMIFTLAAASLGVQPEKCLVIEDAITGIQAAKSANMSCCAIATTLPQDQLLQADIVLESFAKVHPEHVFTNN